MLLWLLIPIPQARARPILLVPIAFNSSNLFDSDDHKNVSLLDAISRKEDNATVSE